MLAYAVRATRWQPVVVAGLPAAVLLGWTRWAPTGWSRPSVTGAFGAAAVLAAIGVAFCLDDPAAVTLDAAPLGAFRRRGWHLVVGGGAALACWGVVVAVAPATGVAGWASAVAAGLCTVALAVGAAGARVLGPVWGGMVGAAAAMITRLGAGVGHHVGRLGPADEGATGRWLGVAAVLALVLAAASRDPAARWRRR